MATMLLAVRFTASVIAVMGTALFVAVDSDVTDREMASVGTGAAALAIVLTAIWWR